MQRDAVVAGQFYPGRKDSLEDTLAALIPETADENRSIALMSPHAGYIYSGRVAGRTFAGERIPAEVIILGPNHTGMGHSAAVYASGSWMTPCGRTAIAADLAERILESCPMTASDTLAHQFEHSLEVQLPFLQYRNPDLSIVPICLGRLPLASLLQLGDGLAAVMQARSELPLLVASTDMTHFESGAAAREKDFKALDRVLALDPEGLYNVVMSNRISMCGVMPTVVMLQAAISLGATAAELILYSNSGDVTGDQSDVVGYAGVRVF